MLWSHVVLPHGEGRDRGDVGPRRARLAWRGANGGKEGLGPDSGCLHGNGMLETEDRLKRNDKNRRIR